MASSLRLINRVERLRKLRDTRRSTELGEVLVEAEEPETPGRVYGPAPPFLHWFTVKASADLIAPYWLEPYALTLQDAIGRNFRIAFHAPPQHGKTELTLRAFLYWDEWHPGYRHAYVTYSLTRAQDKARDFLALCKALGIRVTGTLADMRLPGGSRIRFTSIDAGLTGYPIDGVCVIDDPIRGAEDARSGAKRAQAKRFWKTNAQARRHEGTSFVCMMTRWHVDDMVGFLKREHSFEYIKLQAIAEPENDNDLDDDGRVLSDPLGRKAGESLWDAKPPEFFKEEQKDKHWWAALYQGDPRPEGLAVFGEPEYYDELPSERYRVGYGVDLAYTAKTSADFSVCVEGWLHDGKLYIVRVDRKQVDAPSFTLTLASRQSQRRGPMLWIASGTEKGAASFVRKKVPALRTKRANTDKFMRATDVAAMWNDARVLVPSPRAFELATQQGHVNAALGNARGWVDELISEVMDFTGVDDPHDDQVDALAGLHAAIVKTNAMNQALKTWQKQR